MVVDQQKIGKFIANLRKEKDVNESYFIELANEAINHIAEFGDYDEFRLPEKVIIYPEKT